MRSITVLPHPDCAPAGARTEAAPGTSLRDALLGNRSDIEHAGSEHPVPHAIVAEARGRNLPLHKPATFESSSGIVERDTVQG
ncbi:hypothetical protein MasN3_26710 [Massilia varians]|uniref:Uncharacterized protein n=1 Tax=Massilia varians TaxID=457921 RepID=A0ABM8C7G1_9BURK|nr:hypothetical protein MasN3_26710 [Massilia varians]